MTHSPELDDDLAAAGESGVAESVGTGVAAEASSGLRRVLVVNADASLVSLLEEWLAADGCTVIQDRGDEPHGEQRVDLVIVDVPFPRQSGGDLLHRIATTHCGTPIVALSSAFFAGIDSTGAVARKLGVATVLPMPVTHRALTAAVRDLLDRRDDARQ